MSDTFIKSTCFSTQEKIDGRELACGKFQSNLSPSNFLFYIIELNYSYPNSKVIKKATQILENNCKTNSDEISEITFEKILQNLNEGLGRLAESGENGWLGNLNAIIGLVNEDEILMAQTGSITGYIFRKNKISAIAEKNLKESTVHPLKTFTDITSGQIIADDHLIFGNFDLFNRISLDRIRAITKENDFAKEIIGLARCLKKNKAFDVNAVYIEVLDKDDQSAVNNTPDVIYIDEPDEKLKKFVDKNIKPAAIGTQKFFAKHTPIVIGHCKRIAQKIHYHWKTTIAPKSKELINTGKESVAKKLSKTNIKLLEFNSKTDRGDLSGIRIKTNSYNHQKTKFNIKPFLYSFWNVIRFVTQKENRKYLYIALIVIFIFCGYLKLKSNNDEKSAKSKEVALLNSFDKANDSFSKIKEDIALGKTVDTVKISDALVLAEKSREVPANQDKANALIKDIKVVLDEKTKTVRVYPLSPANFADKLKFIALNGNLIYGINEEQKIYSLDNREKEGKLIGSLNTDYGTPTAMTASDFKQSLIISTSKNRLFSMGFDTRTVGEIKINADPNTWSQANALATYSSNIYILASDNGVVWKHSVKDDGYTKGTSYLDTKKISIRGAVDFSIDGNIYVLTNEGGVLKFVKGVNEADFAIKNIPAPNDKILIPKKIFTDEDTNSIFVLDKKYERIIKFDKAGDYSTQYVLDDKPIDNFVVNAKVQKMWILSEGKIYEGNL